MPRKCVTAAVLALSTQPGAGPEPFGSKPASSGFFRVNSRCSLRAFASRFGAEPMAW